MRLIIPEKAKRGWLKNCRGRVDDEAYRLIIFLQSQGASDSVIAFALNISRGTVFYQIKQPPPHDRPKVTPPGRNLLDMAATMRRRKLVKKYAEKVERHVGPAPGYWVLHRRIYPSARDIKNILSEKHSIDVSVWTVRRDLHSLGMIAKKKYWAPRHRQGDEANRLAFALTEKDCNPEDRVFVDEAILDDNSHALQYEWCYADQSPTPRTSVQYGSKSHCFAMIGIGVKVLVRISAPRVDAAAYIRECLAPHLHHLTKPGVQLVQDNAKAHVAKKTLEWCGANGVRVLEGWPARSPDLNPVEEVWEMLRNLVSRMGATTPEELENAVDEAWESIPQDVIDETVRRYTRKVAACIEARGGHFRVPKRSRSGRRL